MSKPLSLLGLLLLLLHWVLGWVSHRWTLPRRAWRSPVKISKGKSELDSVLIFLWYLAASLVILRAIFVNDIWNAPDQPLYHGLLQWKHVLRGSIFRKRQLVYRNSLRSLSNWEIVFLSISMRREIKGRKGFFLDRRLLLRNLFYLWLDLSHRGTRTRFKVNTHVFLDSFLDFGEEPLARLFIDWSSVGPFLRTIESHLLLHLRLPLCLQDHLWRILVLDSLLLRTLLPP